MGKMSSGTTAAAAAADERTMTAKGKVPRAPAGGL